MKDLHCSTIPELIGYYANLYKEFERMQKEYDSLQNGAGRDQKTGVIGEYYAYMYLQHKGLNPQYGNSEKGWDIIANKKKYQVKTVSSHSKTKRLSTIHKGWHFLIVIGLNDSFEPEKSFEIPLNEFKNYYKYESTIDLKDPFINRYKQYLLPPKWWQAKPLG